MSEYDLIVIGAGPGGYVAAIRAAQLGLKTACVEKRDTLGGTCLNVGCIPSKAQLTSSFKFDEVKNHLAVHGVVVGAPQLDLKAMMAHKSKVVADNVKGIDFLFRKNKIDRLTGEGVITAKGEVTVAGKAYKTKNILIATGSEVGLAVQAFDKLSAQGKKVRVVSMPSTSVFDQQDAGYKQDVLPLQVSARIAIEASHADYWYKYVGLEGRIIGMTTFGESAPAPALFEEFGFTVDNILETAADLLDA